MPNGVQRFDITQSLNSLMRDRRWLRQKAIRLFVAINSLSPFGRGPAILLNGPGKSGTHLLSTAAALLPGVSYSGLHFAYRLSARDVSDPSEPMVTTPVRNKVLSQHELGGLLRRVPSGKFATAHAPYSAILAQTIRALGMKQVMLVRDPRDVVVSYLHFAIKNEWQQHHHHLTSSYASDDDRLLALIEGFPAQDGVEERPSIGEIYERYLPWIDDPQTIVVRFEDLIGPKGGGSRERQLAAVGDVAAHLERPLAPPFIAAVADRVYSQKSFTYRYGMIDGWREVFTDRHRVAFKAVASDVLARLGYEEDDVW